MRWLTIFVVAVAALALVSAGCGGDDEAASDTTELTDTLTDETTTDEETTTDDTDETTTDDDTDLSGVLADEDCLALAAAISSFAGAFAGQGVSDETTAALEDLAEKVPDEIEADVKVLTDAYAKYADEFADIGLEEGQTPTAEQLQQLQAAGASLGDSDVAAASERISAWAEANCTNG
jgi:hypothetical protein